MTDTPSTVEQYAASTNGRVHLDESTESPATVAQPAKRGMSSIIVPILLIATALIILRRMQRGNYA